MCHLGTTTISSAKIGIQENYVDAPSLFLLLLITTNVLRVIHSLSLSAARSNTQLFFPKTSFNIFIFRLPNCISLHVFFGLCHRYNVPRQFGRAQTSTEACSASHRLFSLCSPPAELRGRLCVRALSGADRLQVSDHQRSCSCMGRGNPCWLTLSGEIMPSHKWLWRV